MQATDDLKAASSNVAQLRERAELMGLLNPSERAAAQRDHHHGLGLSGRVV